SASAPRPRLEGARRCEFACRSTGTAVGVWMPRTEGQAAPPNRPTFSTKAPARAVSLSESSRKAERPSEISGGAKREGAKPQQLFLTRLRFRLQLRHVVAFHRFRSGSVS